jgi:cytochrome P450
MRERARGIARASLALPWEAVVDDWIAEMAAARAAHGDTFGIEAADGSWWWFVFGPVGVRAFYELDERDASKGVADWLMLRRKLPPELFDGRRTLPHELFGRHATETYLAQLHAAIEVSFAELGESGRVDVFEWCRRLGHRMGLASWGGEPPALGARFDRLVDRFDALDGSAAFVDPAAMRAVADSDYAAERAALHDLRSMFADSIRSRDATGANVDDLFATIMQRWDDSKGSDRSRGIADDVVLVHLGSMSNLFAALAWTIVDLVARPDLVARVRDGDTALLERCTLESIRIAQRSLMSRAVLRGRTIATDAGPIDLQRGDAIATLLPLTNTTAAAGLDRYQPDRWERRRLRDDPDLAARELVATFGHGSHTCPAQPFSLAAIAMAVGRLYEHYDLTPPAESAQPRAGQIGGVARSAAPYVVDYGPRDAASG